MSVLVKLFIIELKFGWPVFLSDCEKIIPQNIISSISDCGNKKCNGHLVFVHQRQNVLEIVCKAIIKSDANIKTFFAKPLLVIIIQGDNVKIFLVKLQMLFKGF